MMDGMLRINKLLGDAGVCSRREADRWVADGRVTVNGQPVQMGQRISSDADIRVDGRRIHREERKVLLMLNKPRGIICTARRDERDSVVRFVGYPIRVYPVGRLDKDSEGLLLLTNQGELVNRIMRSGNYHEKEYEVTVDREITEEFVKGMGAGVPVLDTVTRPCKVTKTGTHMFRIVLTQGLNRQVRRMCAYFGYEVKKLKRVRIMNLTLKDLPLGEYREVSGEERAELERLLSGSSSLSWKERHG
jgi:23S rRNA pseudouridine2604 synthase